jgi:hydroxymethylglutaryl-CoA lyase
MLDSMGLRTGVDLERLLAVRNILSQALPEIELHGAIARAGLPRHYRGASEAARASA